MKLKRTIILLVILTLVFSVFAGCAAKQEEAVAKDIMDDTTDAVGQTIEADQAVVPETIVSTAPSVTEILFALGCGDKIVGVDIYSNYPAETESIDKIGDYNGFDIEKVIALNPDIVFAGNGLQHDQIASLTDAGLTVVAAEPTYYNDIFTSIALIGEQVGKADEAQALIDDIKAAETELTQNAAALAVSPIVYYVMGIGEYGNWTSGKGSFINSIIEMAGGTCLTADTESEWLEYSVEDLINADPDILIVSSMVAEPDLLADAAYSQLTAVKTGNYAFISADIIERPGPRITEAMALIQGIIIGE